MLSLKLHNEIQQNLCSSNRATDSLHIGCLKLGKITGCWGAGTFERNSIRSKKLPEKFIKLSFLLATFFLFSVTHFRQRIQYVHHKSATQRLNEFHSGVNHQQNLVGGFNPYEKYESKWIISPNFRDENLKKIDVPPPTKLSQSDMCSLMILPGLACRSTTGFLQMLRPEILTSS